MKKRNFLIIIVGMVFIPVLAGYLYVSSNRCLPPPLSETPLNMGEPRSTNQIRIPTIGELPSLLGVHPWWHQQFRVSIDEPVYNIDVRDDTVWAAFSRRVMRYSIKTREVKYYEVLDKSNGKFVVYDILIGTTDSVWALLQSPKDHYTALGRYNPSKDTFEVIADIDGRFQEYEYQDNPLFVKSHTLVETPDGKILIPFKGRILAYSPQSNTTDYLLPESFARIKFESYIPVTALLASEGKVWFTYADDMDLRSIDLQTDEVMNYGHGPSILDNPQWYYMSESYQPIAVDKLGHIWMGYFSILTVKKDGIFSWEKAPYSSHFIITDDPDYSFIWPHLYSIYRSSDGKLWFSTKAGLIEYDPVNNQWCKSTSAGLRTDFLSVTEDDKGNLWTVETNYEKDSATFYKYDLQR